MKLSVITVCHNSEKYIRDAMESVLAQSYPDIEYIIVDGNSSDKTMDIIRSYEIPFAGRLHWISESDNGLYDAMNKGIRIATGEVVGIINSDDFFSNKGVVQDIVKQFEDQSIKAIYGDVRFINPENPNKTIRYYSSRIFSPKMFRFGFMPAHPSFYTYKRYFDEFGYYQTDYKIASDYELLIRFLYTHKLKTKYLAKDFVTMRTGGKSTRTWKSNVLLNQEIVRACKENGIYTNFPLLCLKYFYKIKELFIRN